MVLQEDYQVSLEAFCGPLDLLLYLIRRAEVDIHDIQIAKITHQYLAFLGGVEDIDIDTAGEFLVMAATLMEIKSRTISPPAPTDEAGEASEGGKPSRDIDLTDPRSELIQQLLAYQRYRIAAESLLEQRDAYAQRFPARPDRSERPGVEQDEPPELELEDVHLLDLSEAYERIIASIDFTRLGDHTVEADDTPILLYQEDLLDRLRRTGSHHLNLQDAFTGQNRVQRIGLFLATLELVRLRQIVVKQDEIDSPIEIVLRDEDDDDELMVFEGTEGEPVADAEPTGES